MRACDPPGRPGHESGAAVLERVGPENSTLCRTFSDVGGRRAAILAPHGEYVRSLDLARIAARSSVIEVERELLHEALADVFGFELLQIGAWGRRRRARCRRADAAPALARAGCQRARRDTRELRRAADRKRLGRGGAAAAYPRARAEPARAAARSRSRAASAKVSVVICGVQSAGALGPAAPSLAAVSFRRRPSGCLSEATLARLAEPARIRSREHAAIPVRAALDPAAARRPAPSWLERRGPVHRAAARRRVPAARRASACTASRRSGRRGAGHARDGRRRRRSRRRETRRERSRDLHGRGLPRQPGSRRLGCAADLGRARRELLRRRTDDDQQPHGAHGGHRGARGVEATVPRAALHGFAVRAQRHHRVAAAMEGARLEDRGRKPVKNADLWRALEREIGRHEVDVALGARPFRRCGQRARRRAREPGDRRAAWPADEHVRRRLASCVDSACKLSHPQPVAPLHGFHRPQDPVPAARSPRSTRAWRRCWSTDSTSSGAEVAELEQRSRAYVGTKHCIAASQRHRHAADRADGARHRARATKSSRCRSRSSRRAR